MKVKTIQAQAESNYLKIWFLKNYNVSLFKTDIKWSDERLLMLRLTISVYYICYIYTYTYCSLFHVTSLWLPIEYWFLYNLLNSQFKVNNLWIQYKILIREIFFTTYQYSFWDKNCLVTIAYFINWCHNNIRVSNLSHNCELSQY